MTAANGAGPVVARPGQTYFVPGVRIMRLADKLHAGRDSEAKEIVELSQDIIAVSVTRPCSGAAQYCITLSNWFDSLPRDRAQGIGPREQRVSGQPVWPRFKYNDFAVLDFGMRLRID